MDAGPAGLIVDTVAVAVGPGVELSTEIIRADDESRYPTLLTRTPYGKPHSRIADDVVGMARRGWAIVIQDVRGRGESSGEFEPFVNEPGDAAATLDWIVDQPWSDGRVAMFGGSYRGATAWLAARSGHGALRAIAPYVASARQGEGWTFEGGVPTRGFLRSWALRFASTDPRRTDDERRAAAELANRAAAPADAAADDAALAVLFPTFRVWLNPDDPYWRGVDLNLGRKSAGFYVAGWYDMFCEGTLAGFRAACRASDAPQHLIVGPWSHAMAPGTVVGDLDLGPLADPARFGLDDRRDRFLRAALDGRQALDLRRIDVFQLGSGRWLRLNEWPPRCSPLTLALGPGCTLGSAASTVGNITIRHDPTDPAPAIGGRQPSFWPRPGPIALPSGRHDVVRFIGEPLDGDRDVIGVVRVKLRLRTVGDADLVARLIDIHPDGTAYTIVEHGQRLGSRPTPDVIELPVGSTAWSAASGHQIGLELAPAAWPRLAIRPDPFEVIVELDGISRLELPIAQIQDRSVETAGLNLGEAGDTRR